MMRYTIQNQTLAVTIDTFGAEIVSVKKDGVEKLWQNQTGNWDGHSPILFPICGNCSVVTNGTTYPMPKHGFAKTSQFDLAYLQNDKIGFVLKYDANTLAIYPYKFELLVEYSICDNNLQIDWSVKNVDEKTVFYYFGAHEAHYLSKSISQYKLVFENDEVFNNLNITNNLLDGSFTCLGQGKVLEIPLAKLKDGNSIIFENISSRKVALQDENGNAVLTEQFDNFPHLVLWSPDENRCLCIEPWQNLPDCKYTQNLRFENKPLIQKIEPNEQKTTSRTICYH